MIGLLGLFLSLGAGVGAGALLESIDSRIYGRAGVVRLLGVPPLAVIPVLDTEETENKKTLSLAGGRSQFGIGADCGCGGDSSSADSTRRLVFPRTARAGRLDRSASIEGDTKNGTN